MDHTWTGLALIGACCAAFMSPVDAKDLVLVKGAKPNAVLVIDSRRYPLQEDLTNRWATVERTIQNIAGTVAEYVAKSTGAALPVVDLATAQPPAGKTLVYIGRSDYVDSKLGRDIDQLDPSGYFIRAVDDTHLIIAGPTSEATEFGTYEFLERFVGIRWLMPTEVGDHVPQRRDLTLPVTTQVKDEPAFMQIVGVASMPTHQQWARRQRFFTRLNFHHNLVNLFPPEKYTKTHPQYFPLLHPGDKERHLPVGHSEEFQPCFTAPGIVDEAARNIIAYFDKQPSIRSYSFGVNDGGMYCHCPDCEKEYLPGESFLGMPQYSDAYYKFANAVAEKVLQVHPDVWFGCLAYSNVGKPPVNVGVHPRIIPFLTMDTMQLLDPERSRAHEDLVAAWNAKATFIGRYDYTYGDHHVPPRIYLHHWANYVRWARAHKVKAWYAETYPFFGEAPKYYVMPRIWWNPDRDVDALLEEWYRLSFGKAAPAMKAYFDHWEDYWTRRVPKTEFWTQVKDYQYLLGSPGFLEAATPKDIEQADAWIAQAKRLADTPQTQARVAVMARAWEYYRAVMESGIAQRHPQERLTPAGALALLDLKNAPLARPLHALHDALMEDPILVFTWNSSYPYGSAERAPILGAFEIYLDTKDQRLAAKLQSLAAGADAEVAALARTALAIGSGQARNLCPNGGFEDDPPGQGWWVGVHQGSGTSHLTDKNAFEGKHANEVFGTFDGYGGVFRTDVPIQPGKQYLFVLRSRWEGQPGASTRCQMLTQFYDAQGKAISGTLSGYSYRPTGDWAAYVMQSKPAPPNAVTMLARIDVLGQPQTAHHTYFDALEAYEVSAAGQQLQGHLPGGLTP